ncbi:hypothetical protein LZ32DRAFT_598408 [Colletotrichum eremochloae]|nr:hypothetical protein LZ32DRAFT_598408 [Colletotrichum eremochloae]
MASCLADESTILLIGILLLSNDETLHTLHYRRRPEMPFRIIVSDLLFICTAGLKTFTLSLLARRRLNPLTWPLTLA